MAREDLFKSAARDLAVMLHSDSGIPVSLSLGPIFEALTADDRLPDLYERECLVFGGPVSFTAIDADHPETHGEGNPGVDARFPNTSKTISLFF